MTRQTTQKKTDTGSPTAKVEQPATSQSTNWILAVQNVFSVPRAIHREIC